MTALPAPIDERRIIIPDWVWDTLEDETNFREFYVTKGLGSGGTYGLPIWHYSMCLRNHRSPFSWAIAPTFQQVLDTLIPAFTLAFEEIFGLVEGVDYTANISSRPLIRLLKTGQEIHFRSANRPERLVGPSISHLSCTEPGLYPEIAFQKAFSRVRCTRAECLQKFLEGTPEGLGNGYELRANFPEGVDEEKNRARIILWTEDNPALSREYVRQLYQAYEHDPQKLRSYTRGEFVPFTRGTAYWDFAESRNVTLNLKLDPALPIILAWDFGVSPLPWVAGQRKHHEKNGIFSQRFEWIQESAGTSKGLMDACAEFIAKVDPMIYRDTPIELDGGHDGNNANMFTAGSTFSQIAAYLKPYYNRVSIKAPKSAPEVRDRLERVNALFSYERVVIAAWCRNLIKSLNTSTLKPGTFELKKGKDDPTHFADAIGGPMFWRTQGEDLDKPGRKKKYGVNL